MQRDMSYELDGMFADRNAGELVTVRQTRTKVVRSPGLAPAARMAGGDVRNLTPAMAQRMRAPRPRNIVPRGFRPLNGPVPKSLSTPFFKNARDLAGYEDGVGAFGLPETVNVPVIGPVNTYVAIGGAALLGFALFKLARR